MIHRYIIEATDEIKGFEEAIERLDREWGIEEQEPCNDAISRQAAIDTIESWLSCDDYNKAERHIMRAMQSVLYDLPPVTPQYTDAEIHGKNIPAEQKGDFLSEQI